MLGCTGAVVVCLRVIVIAFDKLYFFATRVGEDVDGGGEVD